MAFPIFPAGTSNPLVMQTWADAVYVEKYPASPLAILDNYGALYSPPEIKNGQMGDLVTVATVAPLEGMYTGEYAVLEGNEEALRTGAFQMTWGYMRHAVKVPSSDTPSQARINFNLADVAAEQLVDYMLQAGIYSMFAQAAGTNVTSLTTRGGQVFTGANLGFVTGFNTVTALNAARIIRPNGVATDQALQSTDTFSLSLIDQLIASVEDANPTFPTADGMLIGFISPQQALQLKQDAGSAVQWYQNALAFAAGGDTDALKVGSAFGTRPIAQYQNVLLYSSTYVPKGVSNALTTQANTARAVFFGANSIFYGSPLGGTYDDDSIPLIMRSETFDYSEYLGIAAKMYNGIKAFAGYSGVGNIYVISTFSA